MPRSTAMWRWAFIPRIGLGRVVSIYPLVSGVRDEPCRIRRKALRFSALRGLWLGHESPATTHQYVEADLVMKERALARLQEPEARIQRYRVPDSLIEFLKTL